MYELTFNGNSFLIFVALIIALTFAFLLLFSRRSSKTADRYLAGLIFVIAFWNASILILFLNVHRYAVGIIWVPLYFTLALGPLLYFYIANLTKVEEKPVKSIWLHLVPVGLESALFFAEVYQGIPQGKGYFQTDLYRNFDPIVSSLALVSFVIYAYYSRIRIKQYHLWVKSNYSHYHRYNLEWLTRLVTVSLLFFIIWLSYFLLDFFWFDYQLSFPEYLPFHLVLSLIAIWLCVEAFIKPEIIYPENISGSKTEKSNEESKSDEVAEKAKWLETQIEQNLLYLDPELSLRSLAEILSIHPNFVSKLINEGLNQTFSDCINTYRINAVIVKLSDVEYSDRTLLSIAFDSGFNSKTTFNRVFKRLRGVTPLQYRNSLNLMP